MPDDRRQLIEHRAVRPLRPRLAWPAQVKARLRPSIPPVFAELLLHLSLRFCSDPRQRPQLVVGQLGKVQ
jgi:hypothetical protein